MIKNLPQDWKIETIGEVCSKASSNISQNQLKDDDGVYPIYGASGFIKNVSFYHRDKDYIAIVKDGAGIGRTTRLKAYSSVIGTLQYIIPNEDIDVNFLYYFLNSVDLTKYQSGSTIPHIYFKDYSRELISIPPLPQQEKIVSVLDTASALVEKQKALLKTYDLFLKSKFIEMFGDPVKNPMGWEFTSLKSFGKIITGNTPSRQIDEYYDDDFIEWVKTDNIKSENMYVGQASEYLSESGMKKARTLESGALLITCIAGSLKSIGTSCLTNRKISFNQQINAIQPYKDIHPYFLYVMFKVSKAYIQTFATASMKKIITKGEFETIELIKPPYALQKQFAQIAEQTEILKQIEQQKLEKLQTLYDALMQRAFVGEIK